MLTNYQAEAFINRYYAKRAAAELFGSDPDFTGDLTTDEYIRQIRGAESTPKSDSTASTTHGNPKSDKLTSCPTDSD